VYNLKFTLKWLLTGLIIITFLNGCALVDSFLGEEDLEEPPAQLMADGMESFESGDFEDATEAFEKIRDRYPYTKYAVLAEIKLADALYAQELYLEAYDAYDDFERLHPKNSRVPYVIYQKGMCYFSQLSSIDRSQSHTLKAKHEFDRLVKKFRKSDYAEMARNRIRECYIQLAEYELYVGHFYFRMEKYRAAIERFRYLIENYPDLGQYHEALEYYRKCKEKLAEAGEVEVEPVRQKKSSFWRKLNPWTWW